MSVDYHEHSSKYCWNVHVKVVPCIAVVRKINHQQYSTRSETYNMPMLHTMFCLEDVFVCVW